MLFKKKEELSILKEITGKNKLGRFLELIIGLLILSLSFNLFILPLKITYGVSGIAIIINNFYNIDPSLLILLFSFILLVISYLFLGKEATKRTILGSLLYPLFVKLTANITGFIDLGTSDTIILVLFGAVTTGFGLGIIFKSGYTTGGTDILNQIVSKYFKVSLGNSMFFTDGIIILSGVFVFGYIKLMYSILTLYIISIMTDKVVLGISQSKTFFIVTEHETAIKRFITNELKHGVTVFDARGGFTGNKQKVIMCIIPTDKYFLFKEGINRIDNKAFFIALDAYEASGGA
ncbi:MAG: YitT family protein [Bacilli bacterium]|nr:YitT family protein [Bacilli bacterium]